MDDGHNDLAVLVRTRPEQVEALFPRGRAGAHAILIGAPQEPNTLRAWALDEAARCVEAVGDGGWPLPWPESATHFYAALRLAAPDARPEGLDREALTDAEGAWQTLGWMLKPRAAAERTHRMRRLKARIVETAFAGQEPLRTVTLTHGALLVTVIHIGDRLHTVQALAGSGECALTDVQTRRLAEAATQFADDRSLYCFTTAEIHNARRRR